MITQARTQLSNLRQRLRPSLPPGPKSKAMFTLRYREDPHGYYASLLEKYGEPFTVPMIYGNLVVTAHPDGAHPIFTADPNLFDNWGAKPLIPFFGESSMALNNGERHHHLRKVVMPALHGSRMRSYGELMQRRAADVAKVWEKGVAFDMEESTRAFSLSVIIEAVFGVIDPERHDRFKEAILAFVDPRVNLPFLFPVLRREFFGYGPWARFLGAKAHVDALIYKQIEQTRNADHPGDSIMSRLLAARYDDGSPMKDEVIRDQLITLLVAGHETSTLGLCWAFYWLYRNPEVLKKLEAEIEGQGTDPSSDTINELPYLEAVCHETLRIRPIASDVPRVLREPMILRGHEIPPGNGVVASAYLIHHREDLYPEPDRFRPERFIERKYSPFEYLPFGGGARRCIGAAFSLYEMKMALFTILRARKLELGTRRTIPFILNGFVNAPKGGIPMYALDNPSGHGH